MIKKRNKIFNLLIVISLFWGGVEPQVIAKEVFEGSPPEHIFLITFDAFRGDSYSFINPEEAPSTPHIDALAKDSVVFSKAFSPSSWTTASFSAVMTGLAPLMYLQEKNLTGPQPLSEKHKTLAEYLNEKDYSTFAFIQHPWVGRKFNFDQGFDYFFEYSINSRRDQKINWWSKEDVFIKNKTSSNMDHDFFRKVQEKSINLKDSFVWMHFIDPHQPYAPPTEFIDMSKKPKTLKNYFIFTANDKKGISQYNEEEKKWIRHLYNGNIRVADNILGNIINFLKKEDLYDNSLIIFSSDHGEEFWETGVLGHGHNHHPVELHIPLMVKLPEREMFHNVVDEEVTTLSLLPTLLEVLNIDREKIEFNNLMPPSLKEYLNKKNKKKLNYQFPIFFYSILHQAEENQKISVYQNSYSYSLYSDGRENLSIFNTELTDKQDIKRFSNHRLYPYLKEELYTRKKEMIDVESKIEGSLNNIEYSNEEAKALKTLGYLQ